MLLVGNHLELLSAQFLANALQPDHPSHLVVNLPQGPRHNKDTLSSKVGHLFEPHLVNGIIPPGTYKSFSDQIHTHVVREAIARSSVNRVLGTPAPKINLSESSLSLVHPRCAGIAEVWPLFQTTRLSTLHR